MKLADLPRVGLGLCLLAMAIVALIHAASLREAEIVQLINSAGGWAPVAFVVLYAVATVSFVPDSLLTLAAGALFGPVVGAFYSLVGATTGATVAFLIARYLTLHEGLLDPCGDSSRGLRRRAGASWLSCA